MFSSSNFPFASTAADTIASMARTQAAYLDSLTAQSNGTPMAPLFDMASQFQHATVKSLEALGSVTVTKTAKSETKQTSKSATGMKKKAAKAQAD